MRKILLVLCLTIMSCYASAVRKAPYTGSRIFWDMNSQTTVFNSGTYSRIIELQDGRLLAVAEWGGINISFSSNKGKTWTPSEKIVFNPGGVNLAVPDLVQLSDGTILIGYNPRPNEPYSDERKFGIRVVRSTDNGVTWSAPIYIFDAQSIFIDGCWEPSFLELPSGEVQCYFANENEYTYSWEQCISMSRSFDKGLTWSEPEKVSFRAGSRDGMPVPVLLKDKSDIVVIIEDNGWPGRGNFAATTVRTTLEDNWKSGYVDATSSNRNMIFEEIPAVGIVSAAPYLRVLPNGETIASYQGNENRDSNLEMFVEVGDSNAKNFKARSTPFALTQDKSALWNSVSVISDGTVLAVGSISSANEPQHVEIIKGHPKKEFKANFGTPTIDASISGDSWTYPSAQQVFMGHVTKNKTTADFLYDNEYLYFTARVIDRNIFTDKIDDDGIYLYLDLENACDNYPQKGMFQFFFDVNGTAIMKYGDTNKWYGSPSIEGLQYKLNVKSIYYEMEVAIPWKLMGYSKPPVNNEMRINLEIQNRYDGGIAKEVIPETKPRESWTWMEFSLMAAPSGVENMQSTVQDLKLYLDGSTINIESPSEMEHISFYSFDGKLLGMWANCGCLHQIQPSSKGVGIIKIRLKNGSIVSRKIIF